MKMSIWSTTALATLEDFFIDDPDLLLEIGAAFLQPQADLSSKHLSKIWNIKEDLAKQAIDQTTNLYRQGADNNLSWRFLMND